jgi:transcription elongation factor Elf1
MSMSRKANITCPACGTQQEIELYEAVNAAENPELKQALLENRLNRIECSNCEASFRVDLPMLYTDPGYNILIHWIPETAEMKREQIIEEFDDSLNEINKLLPADIQAPSVRLVLTRVELVELIFMIEAGLDPRVVEYVKYSIHTRNMEKVDPLKTQLLLNVQDSTDEELHFVMQDVQSQTLGSTLHYGRAAYQSLCELCEENPEEFFEMFPGPYLSARNLLLEEVDTGEA